MYTKPNEFNYLKIKYITPIIYCITKRHKPAGSEKESWRTGEKRELNYPLQGHNIKTIDVSAR